MTQLRPERDATDRADFLEKVDEMVVQHFFVKIFKGRGIEAQWYSSRSLTEVVRRNTSTVSNFTASFDTDSNSPNLLNGSRHKFYFNWAAIVAPQ